MKALTSGPRLMTQRLVRGNRAASRRRGRILAACLGAAVAALAFAFQPALLVAVGWLQSHLLMTCATLAFITAVVVARHRATLRAEFKNSWLSALPVPLAVARRESAQLELFPAIAACIALSGLMALIEVGFFARSARFASGPIVIGFWLLGAVLLGAVASYAIRETALVEAPPGSRYVPKGQSRRGRALQPSLSALGQWPLRRMFASAQPKLVARALMPVLLSMGIQTTADTAMVVIGLFAAAGALALLIPSVLAVSGAALRWLAPLPLSGRTLLRVVCGRAVLTVLGISALAGFFLTLMDVSAGRAAGSAAMLASISVATMVIGVGVRLTVRP